jgi:putative Ca2+/H+ antiporter (TMEM165/GDT1 family)
MDFSSVAAAAGLLFVMEFADKTQLAVMSLTARTGRFFPIVIGATAALAALAFLAAAAGGVLTRFLPGRWVSLAAGASFLAFGVFMLWRALVRAESGADTREGKAGRRGGPTTDRPAWRDAALTFGLVFVAELGDKSQLAVIGLAADTGHWVPVFVGAALGLSAMTVVGALAGAALQKVVPAWVMRFGPGVVFVAVGGLSLASVV